MSTTPAVQHTELSKEQKARRAEEAKRLLEHPLLKEAFANLHLNYFEAFSKCPPHKVHERDAIFHCNRVLTDVQTHLNIVISQGRIERQHIERVQKAAAAK